MKLKTTIFTHWNKIAMISGLTVYLGIEDIYKLFAYFLLSHFSLGGLLS